MLSALAFRNLWRNRRRTLLTLSAMIVSAALLILSLGVFSGMIDDMLTTTTRLYHGHLVLATVITSYSIHYTKLYDAANAGSG